MTIAAGHAGMAGLAAAKLGTYLRVAGPLGAWPHDVFDKHPDSSHIVFLM
jgi:expansin (peptidoglycan-binding protein)